MSAELQHIASRDLSRRRVLAATAWAAPAIVIASALPAAAASVPPTPSALTLSSVTLARRLRLDLDPVGINRSFEAGAAVAVTGGSASSIVLTLAFPAATVGANAVTVTSGSAWQLTGSAVDGAWRVFSFSYSQSVAAGSSTSTLQIRARTSMAGFRRAVTVNLAASGVGSPVASISPTNGTVSLPAL